jgi:hypothetical protein
MPRHLRLCHLKIFALRVHEIEATERAAETALAAKEWRRVASHLAIEIEDELAARPPRDHEQLDAFITRILSHQDVSAPGADPAAELRANLHQRHTLIDCAACAAQAGAAPCSGRIERDAQLAALGGACIAPIHRIVGKALDITRKCYADAGITHAVATELVTAYGTPAALHGTPLTVGGQVTWRDTQAAAHSDIEILVNVPLFNRHGLKLLPYCAMHEAMCHVFQSVAGGPRLGEPDTYDAFAEGWMDYIAAELVAGSEGQGDFGPAGDGPWQDAAIGQIATETHLQRANVAVPGAFRYVGKVQLGRQAARAVLRVFVRHQAEVRLERAAWQDFVALSCQLNAAAWDADMRGRALAGLPARLGATMPSRVDADLVDALTRWRHRRGYPGAIDAVVTALMGDEA